MGDVRWEERSQVALTAAQDVSYLALAREAEPDGPGLQ